MLFLVSVLCISLLLPSSSQADDNVLRGFRVISKDYNPWDAARNRFAGKRSDVFRGLRLLPKGFDPWSSAKLRTGKRSEVDYYNDFLGQ